MPKAYLYREGRMTPAGTQTFDWESGAASQTIVAALDALGYQKFDSLGDRQGVLSFDIYRATEPDSPASTHEYLALDKRGVAIVLLPEYPDYLHFMLTYGPLCESKHRLVQALADSHQQWVHRLQREEMMNDDPDDE
jgi:hypothetical protein